MSGSPTLRAFSLEGQCPKAGSEWAIMLGKEMSSHCRVIASPIFDAPTWRGYKRSQRLESIKMMVTSGLSMQNIKCPPTVLREACLKLSGCKLGLLINFNVSYLKEGIRRMKS